MGDRTRVISDFSALPVAPGEGKAGEYWYHEDTQVWFDDADHYRAVRSMCRISCTVCEGSSSKRVKKGRKVGKPKHNVKFGSIEQLKGHLIDQHCLYMCDLCLDGRKVFTREQKLYTKPQLNQHIKSGDSEVDGSGIELRGFVGHPMCKFCNSPFYGDNELDTHMTREHYSCHICQRQHSGQCDYFRNYDDLEAHFRSDHFFCEDRECLENKFVVFQSEAELKRHNAVEHRDLMHHARKNLALQTSTGSREWSEQERSHGRGRRNNAWGPIGAVDNTLLSVRSIANVGRGLGNQVTSVAAPLPSLSICSGSGQSSQAGQSSGTNRVLQQSYFSPLSRQEVPDARIGSVLQEASSPPVSESYTPALSRSSRNAARIRDEAFPPLPGISNRSAALTQQGVRKVTENTRASGFQQQSKGTVITHQLRSVENTDSIPFDSSRSLSSPMPNPSPDISGSSSLSSAGNERKGTLVNSQMCPVEDVRAANNFLVERIRTALGMDQDRYTMFKELSVEYRQGVINASKYLSYVEQFGLSHLVLEMARLLPDPQKQKELADAYYTNLRLTSLQGNGGGGTVTSKEGNRKKKGKGKVPDATGTTSATKDSPEDKFLKATRKLQSPEGNSRVVLREGCGATSGSSHELGWPVKGAWQNHGGQRLLSNLKK